MLGLGLALAITVTQADVAMGDCESGRTPIVVAVARMFPNSDVWQADTAIVVDGRAYVLTDAAYDATWEFCRGNGRFDSQTFFAVPDAS